MKEILLLGKVEKEDFVCTEVEKSAGCKLHQTVQVRDALRFIRDTRPEFMLVAGNIGKNTDGSYYIQL